MTFVIKWCFFVLCAFSCISASWPQREKECVVLVCNKKYFPKFVDTVQGLTTKGKYHGDICLVIGNDLVNDELLNHEVIRKNHVIVKHFPDLEFPESFLNEVRQLPRYGKLFQYHKLYLFNPYFKQWDTVLYIDSGMKIFADIRTIMNTKQPNTLLAHSDAYPTYSWKLSDQFNKENRAYYDRLHQNFRLDIDYFQTTMMLYDPQIIEENTFEDLYRLALEYPISITNEQGIMALYFTNVKPLWKQIPVRNKKTCLYDYLKRNKQDKYVMLKI
jgi:hypothetical protein